MRGGLGKYHPAPARGRSQIRATGKRTNAGRALGLTANRSPGARNRQGGDALERHEPARLLASAPPPRWVPTLHIPARLAEPALAAAASVAERAQRAAGSVRGRRTSEPTRYFPPRAWGFSPTAPASCRSPPPLASPAELGAPKRIK